MKSAGIKSLKPLTKTWCLPWHVHNHLEESAFVPAGALQVVGKQNTSGFSWMWWEKMRPCSSSLKVRLVSRDALTVFGGSKTSNCLGVIEEEGRKKKCSEIQSCIYTKLLWKTIPEWSITNSTNVLQCLFFFVLWPEYQGKADPTKPAVEWGSCLEENLRSAWGLFAMLHFWNLSDFRVVRDLTSFSVLTCQVQRIFLPLTFWNDLIVTGKMVIVSVSSGPFWRS